MNGREKHVARFAPAEFRVFPEYDLAAQAKVMQCLAPTGVPVPRVRWLEEDAGVLGQAFYIMDALAGELPEATEGGAADNGVAGGGAIN